MILKDPDVPLSTKIGVTLSRVQYDGDGKWVDLHFSTNAAYRLDVSLLVDTIVRAISEHDSRVGLLSLTEGNLLRWGKDDEEV